MPMNVSVIKMPAPAVQAARVLIGFWLAGWFLKWTFFHEYLFSTIISYPFLIDLFPLFFRSAYAAQFFYLLPLLAVLAFVRPHKFYFCFAAVIMIVSSAVLLLHQDMHNDATFVTSFWTALWLLWFTTRMERQDQAFFVHARSLALCVVAVIFWGGFVGKLTPEYWSGQVMADIFMEQNFGWVSQWAKTHFSEEAIRFCFQWVSKAVILGEAVLSFAPLLPYRFVCFFGIPFMTGISLFTTWRIFSVLFSLMGLLVAGSRLKK
jgi:hypothetical protein